jgi:pyruvate,water dikinase
MVRSDLAGAGVMFSIDTETGFDRVVLINAAWGLGENVVQGTIDPDEYQVFKPLLSDAGLNPIVHKQCGGKLLKMIYTRSGAEPTCNVETTPAERSVYVLSDAEILQLARASAAPSSNTMAARWTLSGQRTAEAAKSSSSRRGLRRCSHGGGRVFNAHILSSRRVRSSYPA